MQNDILLIRHAQSGNNALPEDQRLPDPGLTELGQRQAGRLAQELTKYPIGHLYCSPFKRSLETTVPIHKAVQLTPRIRADIYEQGGCYEGYLPGQKIGRPGLNRAQLQAAYPHWEVDPSIGQHGWNAGRGYETAEEVVHRARRVASWLSSLHQGGEGLAALVIHADFKRVLMEVMLQSNRWLASEQPIWNTSVSQLRYENARWHLIDWNATRHLESHMLSD